MSIIDKIQTSVLHRKEKLNGNKKIDKREDTVRKRRVDDTLVDENGVYEVVERTIYPNKIICPDCGGVTTEGLEFCDKCAGELHKMFQ